MVNRPFGAPGDRAAPYDHDGDGTTDLAVFRPETGEAFLLRSRDDALRLAFEGVGRRTRLVSPRWAWLDPEASGPDGDA